MITALRAHRVILPGLRFGIVAALAIPGLLLAWIALPLSRWITAAVVLQMISLLSVFVTERYRLAVVPGLLLFAGYGTRIFWESCVMANYRRAGIYVLLLVLATWFVSIPKRDPSLWALDSYNAGWQALESNELPLAEQKLKVAFRLAQGDKPTAKSYYFATLHLDPNHEGAYNNLGILALEEKRWSLAAKFFAKALEQDPNDAKTHYLLAKILLIERDLENARKEIDRAIELEPNQPEFAKLRQEIAGE